MFALFLLLGIVLAVVAVQVHRAAGEFVTEYEWVAHTYEVKEAIVSTAVTLRGAEAAQRAYFIGGSSSRLAEYYAALPTLKDRLSRLRRLVSDNPSQAATAKELEAVLDARLIFMASLLVIHQNGGLDALRVDPAFNKGQQQDADVDRLTERMLAEEEALLAERRNASYHQAALTRWVTIGAVATCFVVLGFALTITLREQARRLRSEAQTAKSYAELATSLEASRRLSDTLRSLTDLGDMLQGCRDLDEAATGVQAAMAPLFPEASGTVALINASQNLVAPLCAWGAPIPGDSVFAPDDCWALRRGRAYPEDGAQAAFACKHIDRDRLGAEAEWLCVPLLAQGSMLGILTLTAPRKLSSGIRETAAAATEQISLAIANLRLQETLRTQSLRDPLTGLFNRRYLEESLSRDVARAIRSSQPLAVLMIDVDHFKSFNDTHGHDAGDTVLAQLGELLASLMRNEDVACRYGGEEFTVVLQEADAALALDRAEGIRSAVQASVVHHRRQPLGPISVSIGIASYPLHGDSPDQLLKRADRALYTAKHNGRNQVCVADR